MLKINLYNRVPIASGKWAPSDKINFRGDIREAAKKFFFSGPATKRGGGW